MNSAKGDEMMPVFMKYWTKGMRIFFAFCLKCSASEKAGSAVCSVG